jgi:hypothetical protein
MNTKGAIVNQQSTQLTHELARDAALRLARDLSLPGAFEVWRAMQMLDAGAPTDSVSGSVLKLAEMFHSYPEVCDYMSQTTEGGMFRTDDHQGADH